jgi:hypothetical protein
MIGIDYIKLYLLNININRLLRLPQLDFKCFVTRDGIRHENILIAEYHYCRIKVVNLAKVEFSGSLHKMWNALNGIKAPNHGKTKIKGYNGNQFLYTDMMQAREHLNKLFDCSAEQLEIHNIEFGANLAVLFYINKFLKGLLYHVGVAFRFRYKKHFAIAKHSLYDLKIYNKSAMYAMSSPVLRIELKIKRMEELKQHKINIVTMADINRCTLQKALLLIIQRVEEVIFYDYTIDSSALKTAAHNHLKQYSDVGYWMQLDSNRRDRPKKELNKITANYSANLSSQIKTLLLTPEL